MTDRRAVPVALTIAGSDSSAGAGAQADLKTFASCGVYGLTAITCVVAEIPGRVTRIAAVEADVIAEQVRLLLDHFPVAAIKTGMLFSAEIVSRVAECLRPHRRIPIVIDPVMVATSGDLLLQKEAIDVYERELFPLAAVITPNLDEAAALLGAAITDLQEMRRAGKQLAAKYGVPMLLKGGHLGGDIATDLLFVAADVREFSAPFSRGVHTHGTGCTYSAAIAAALASGLALEAAVSRAKKYVTAAIAQHFAWSKEGHPAAIHALNHSVAGPNL